VYETIRELTIGVARGEQGAVELFYRRFFDLLYGHAQRLSRRDENFCLDVVHDCMLRIVRTIRHVETEAQLAAWLKLVVQSVAYDLLRREQRRIRREKNWTPGPTPSPNGEHQEQIDWLRREIAALDSDIVRLIELRYEQDWTLARIGRLMGLSVGTVDGRLRRAIRLMRVHASEVFDERI